MNINIRLVLLVVALVLFIAAAVWDSRAGWIGLALVTLAQLVG